MPEKLAENIAGHIGRHNPFSSRVTVLHAGNEIIAEHPDLKPSEAEELREYITATAKANMPRSSNVTTFRHYYEHPNQSVLRFYNIKQ